MANTSAPEAASRRRVIYVFLTQGIAGLLLVVTMTVLRFHETALIVERLGPAAPLLIVLFFAFGLFGTYGIPVVVASALYERLGGEVPVLHATPAVATKIAISGIAMIFTNELLMYRPMKSYGYNTEKITKLYFADASIYLLSLP